MTQKTVSGLGMLGGVTVGSGIMGYTLTAAIGGNASGTITLIRIDLYLGF